MGGASAAGERWGRRRPAAAKLLTFRTNDTNKILARILVVECYSGIWNASPINMKHCGILHRTKHIHDVRNTYLEYVKYVCMKL